MLKISLTLQVIKVIIFNRPDLTSTCLNFRYNNLLVFSENQFNNLRNVASIQVHKVD